MHVILRDLSRSGQYLHRGLSHQLNPLSFRGINLGLVGGAAVFVLGMTVDLGP